MEFARSTVLVCGGTGCTSSGSQKVLKEFNEQIQAKGLEKEVKVVQTGCFGLCALGPVVIVYPEGSFYSMVKPEDVEEIVTEHLLKGRIVKRLLYEETVEEDTIKSLNEVDEDTIRYSSIDDGRDEDFTHCVLAQGDSLADESTKIVVTFKGYLEVRLSEYSVIRSCDIGSKISFAYISRKYIDYYKLRNGDEILCTCSEIDGNMVVTSLFNGKYKVTNYPLDYGNWLKGEETDNSYNPDLAKQILEQNGWE